VLVGNNLRAEEEDNVILKRLTAAILKMSSDSSSSSSVKRKILDVVEEHLRNNIEQITFLSRLQGSSSIASGMSDISFTVLVGDGSPPAVAELSVIFNDSGYVLRVTHNDGSITRHLNALELGASMCSDIVNDVLTLAKPTGDVVSQSLPWAVQDALCSTAFNVARVHINSTCTSLDNPERRDCGSEYGYSQTYKGSGWYGVTMDVGVSRNQVGSSWDRKYNGHLLTVTISIPDNYNFWKLQRPVGIGNIHGSPVPASAINAALDTATRELNTQIRSLKLKYQA
jgi:hypothetical protein